MNADLTTIDVSGAKLPSTYQAAKRAISQCASIDECKDWSDRAAALASYAKQAGDDQLEKMARRIRARATRRAGELLKQIEPSKGGRPSKNSGSRPPEFSRAAAARGAGLSRDQAKQAQRLANVPEAEFEDMVESGATVTMIAEFGTNKATPNRDEAKALHKAVRHYLVSLRKVDMAEAVAGLDEAQKSELRMMIARLDAIHDQIATSI